LETKRKSTCQLILIIFFLIPLIYIHVDDISHFFRPFFQARPSTYPKYPIVNHGFNPERG